MVNRNERYWKNKEERAAAAKNHLAYVYYIFRHRVGVPRHLDVCLADEKNGSNFIFQTKDAAQRCLEKEFRKGRAFHDQKYGYVKHYIRYFYS